MRAGNARTKGARFFAPGLERASRIKRCLPRPRKPGLTLSLCDESLSGKSRGGTPTDVRPLLDPPPHAGKEDEAGGAAVPARHGIRALRLSAFRFRFFFPVLFRSSSPDKSCKGRRRFARLCRQSMQKRGLHKRFPPGACQLHVSMVTRFEKWHGIARARRRAARRGVIASASEAIQLNVQAGFPLTRE